MKKLKIFSVILLLVSTSAFIAFQSYRKSVEDKEPPVITCDTAELTVSVEATTEDLLQGVTAQDHQSGDVTDTVVVENISSFTEEGTRIITYAAVDDSMNVGRCERTLIYKDYKAPTFDLSAPLCFYEGQTVDLLSAISAKSSLDGSLTENIKYSLKKIIDTAKMGSYPIEYRVMDSAGKVVYLTTEIQIYDQEYAGIDVELDDYLVYVNKGKEFDPEKYLKNVDTDLEYTVEIRSDVDTEKKGIYNVDYIVDTENEKIKGKTRLIVVVR